MPRTIFVSDGIFHLHCRCRHTQFSASIWLRTNDLWALAEAEAGQKLKIGIWNSFHALHPLHAEIARVDMPQSVESRLGILPFRYRTTSKDCICICFTVSSFIVDGSYITWVVQLLYAVRKKICMRNPSFNPSASPRRSTRFAALDEAPSDVWNDAYIRSRDLKGEIDERNVQVSQAYTSCICRHNVSARGSCMICRSPVDMVCPCVRSTQTCRAACTYSSA